MEQYDAYIDFSYEKGILKKDSDKAKKIEMQRRVCQKDLASDGGSKVDYPSCESILNEILSETATTNSAGKRECYNMYDVRLKDTYPSCGMNWPPDLKSVVPYLRRKDVTDALHINTAKNTGWQECSGSVGSNFHPTSPPSVKYLPDILAEVPVLLFSGAEDLICNHLGTEALIGNMNWNGGKGFELAPGTWAPRREWTVEGEVAGFWQNARNLTYVLFHNSSHMVPFDVARRSRDMLDRFMGVDISSIGGKPTDSFLDGERLPDTTVGGQAGNSTASQEAEAEKLEAAKWEAYQRSGEIILVIVSVAAAAWGYWVWKERRKRRGYLGLAQQGSTLGLSTSQRRDFRSRGATNARDLEAADFDEAELDDLHVESPIAEGHEEGLESERRYSLGGDSDEDSGTGAHKEGSRR